MNSRTLHLHIDRLVVEGVPAHGRQRFVGALESELTKLASDGLAGALAGSRKREIASLDAGTLRHGATPEQAAKQVTSALRRGLAGRRTGRHV